MRSVPRRVNLVAVGVAVLAMAAACAPTQVAARPTAQPTTETEATTAAVTGLQFVANNATTAANASLVQTTLTDPAGSGLGGQSVWLPSGFTISVVASGLKAPRFTRFDAAGNLLVADMGAGVVYRYPASNGSIDPAGTPPAPLLSGLNAPSNVAFFGGYLYVGETNAISRYPYDPATGTVGAREVVVPNLPVGGHSTRTVAFGPDGMMYVSVGSSCNICDERDERRAAILRFAPDGTGYERFAWGLRNAVGLAFQPGTGLLWATTNERDNQGNEVPPDLVTIVREGENFGWPGCQPPDATPQQAGRDCSGITPPTIGIQAHSAPLGLAFVNAQQFPSEYQDDLLVVQHGSWNRQPPAAPKLLRVDMDNGRPVRAEDFATGWQDDASGRRWGRTVGVTPAPDGSVIVSDDQAGVLYRISYSAG